jgi:hypothetical protein
VLQLAGDPRRVDARADGFADDVGRALTRVANATARGVSAVPSELDLARVRAVWRQQVTDVLLPVVEREWRRAADATWAAVVDGLPAAAVVAAVGVDEPTRVVNANAGPVPKVSIEAARTYLETAQNRLVGVGDQLWEKMREELVSGLAAGEGSADVARRLRSTADLTRPRASVIARTEVIGATNRGAYAQVLATGMTGTKTWLATGDSRTRPSHAAASGQTVRLGGQTSGGGTSTITPVVEKTFDDKLAEALSERNADDGVSTRLYGITDEAQRKSFDRYVGTAYERINGQLRSGGELSENVREHVKNMDAVFADATTSEPIVSYRGVLSPDKMFGSAWGDFDLAGLEWVDDGFGSTTAIERIAQNFTSDTPQNAAMFRIITPTGSKMVYLGDQEHELLLNRGTKFRVVRDNGKNEAGTRMLDVEVLST